MAPATGHAITGLDGEAVVRNDYTAELAVLLAASGRGTTSSVAAVWSGEAVEGIDDEVGAVGGQWSA